MGVRREDGGKSEKEEEEEGPAGGYGGVPPGEGDVVHGEPLELEDAGGVVVDQLAVLPGSEEEWEEGEEEEWEKNRADYFF